MILKPGVLVGIVLGCVGLGLVMGSGWPLIFGGVFLFLWEVSP